MKKKLTRKKTSYKKLSGPSGIPRGICRYCGCKVGKWFDMCDDCTRQMSDEYESGQTY